MSVSKENIATSYPLPVYNYRVEIGSEAVAFSEVSGLSITYETSVYKESPTAGGLAGPRVFQVPAQRSPVKITLKKGLVRTASIKHLYGWISGIETNRVEKKDIFVRLCDDKGVALISWKVANAFPTKLDAPAFSATSNDAAIESMELTADLVSIQEA